MTVQNLSEKEKEKQARIEFINRCVDYFFIGLLFMVMSIPIFTMGASISALYKAIYDDKISSKPKILKNYWKAFKNSFKQSTITWSIFLLLILAFVLNHNSLINQYSLFKDALQILHIFMIFGLTPIVIMMLFYISRFTDTLSVVLKNTSLILLINFGKAIVIFIGTAIVVICMWIFPLFGVILPPLFIAKGMGMTEKIFSQLTNSTGE